jgi:polysaccharide biosynthesis/export protein
VLSVDLIRYYATGDPAFNPYLLDGDRVFVPTVEAGDHRQVFVERESGTSFSDGPTHNRSFDYRSDDTVSGLLLVKGGPSLLESTDVVRLLRTGPDGRLSTESINVADIRNGSASDVALRPLDRLLIPRPAERHGSASVVGEVRYPGSYPIIDDVTTLRDLVDAAGGIRPEALLRGAYLERQTADQERDERPAPAGRAVDEAVAGQRAQERVLERERATFESARLSDLGFGSRSYLAREMIEFRRVSLNLGDDPSTIPAIPLRNGDRFVVPPDPRGVMVLGQVRHPGYVPVEVGADAEYYVEAAGGRGPAATGTFVRESGSGYIRPADGVPVRSGDIVFVDRQPIADTEALQQLALQERNLQLQQEQQRRQSRAQLVQMGVALVSATATIITTYLFLTRN